jgi:hypothetical protein
MKEAYYIKDYVVINPELTIVSRKGEIPPFSKSETVVLALACDEHPLSYSLLLEQTKWSETYADSVIDGLIEKQIAQKDNNQIILVGFETLNEKAERHALEEELEKKLQEKARLRKEQQEKLELELRGMSEPNAEPAEEEEPKEFEVNEEDFDKIIGSEFVGDRMDEEIHDEAIIEGIITIFENYEHMNGGLMDVRLIRNLLAELYPDVTIEQILKTVESLGEMGLVREALGFSETTVLLFKEMVIDEEMKLLLGSILKNGWMNKTEIGEKLSWDEEQTLNVMKRLQDIEVLRLDEKNRVVIPGLVVE